jgi:hypothetical protein
MLLLGTKGDAMDALAITTILEIMGTPRHGLKAGVEITAVVAVIMGVVQEPHLGIKNLHHLDKLAMGTADTLHTPLPQSFQFEGQYQTISHTWLQSLPQCSGLSFHKYSLETSSLSRSCRSELAAQASSHRFLVRMAAIAIMLLV